MQPTLIIDADDTLWENEVYYQQCVDAFATLVTGLGFDAQQILQILDQVEAERVLTTGYGPYAFIDNMIETYQRICAQAGQPVDTDVPAQIRHFGQIVVKSPVHLLPGVAETLPQLGRRFRLILLTKGDHDVQTDKLTRSGLAHLFDGVHVVHEKDESVFRELLETYNLQPHQTWMIGNSPKSDINPALAVGIGAVHIPHTTTWVLEQEPLLDAERVTVLDHFGELLALFDAG